MTPFQVPGRRKETFKFRIEPDDNFNTDVHVHISSETPEKNMPLVEYVGGPRDGLRGEVICLDERLAIPSDDDRRQDIYIRMFRLTSDKEAEIYCHEDHDEAYRRELGRAVANLQRTFPRHQFQYTLKARSIDWIIRYDGKSHESTLARALDMSLQREDRPHLHHIVQHVCTVCRELSGEKLEPPNL